MARRSEPGPVTAFVAIVCGERGRRAVGASFLLALLIRPVYSQRAPADPGKPSFTADQERFERRMEGVPASHFAFDPAAVYTLPNLIDIAESRSPDTKEAWQAARAQAAALGIAKGELYPTVKAFLSGFANQNGVLLYNQFVLQDLGIGEAGVSLEYTLFDFGAKSDRIEAQRGLLQAANFAFNDTHRKLIFAVTQAYYQLLSAAGQRHAAEASLKAAEAVAEATQARFEQGLATSPDVAEARSNAAQAGYDLQIRVGDEQKASGLLATLLTAPAYSQFKVQSIYDLNVPERLVEGARALIEEALRTRPDLLEQVAVIETEKAEQRNARKSYYPALGFAGDWGRLRAWGDQTPLPAAYATGNVYDATLKLSWTVFDGGKREGEIARTKALEKEAESKLNRTRDGVESQVWNAYVNAQTALRQRDAAKALLGASQESYDMSLEAYQSGVRNIVDVLQAQRQLAEARSEDVSARAAVLMSMAEIAFQTGELLRRPQGRQP